MVAVVRDKIKLTVARLDDAARPGKRCYVSNLNGPHPHLGMADMDVFSAMGISGFGKVTKKKQLDPARFDKNKREQVRIDYFSPWSHIRILQHQLDQSPSTSAAPRAVAGPLKNDVQKQPGPSIPVSPLSHPDVTADARRGEDEEGWVDARDFEYDPDAQDTDIDVPQFPITHEITLKDHMKVISALALDPSGARVLSGSHDYDCKLWDFGGMDARCKPFKTWEPAGNYHVSAGRNFCAC